MVMALLPASAITPSLVAPAWLTDGATTISASTNRSSPTAVRSWSSTLATSIWVASLMAPRSGASASTSGSVICVDAGERRLEDRLEDGATRAEDADDDLTGLSVGGEVLARRRGGAGARDLELEARQRTLGGLVQVERQRAGFVRLLAARGERRCGARDRGAGEEQGSTVGRSRRARPRRSGRRRPGSGRHQWSGPRGSAGARWP